MEQDLKSEQKGIDWEIPTLNSLKGTDPYGNKYLFKVSPGNKKEFSIFLQPADGKTRNLGKVTNTEKGFVYSKYEDEEVGIMNNTFSWSVPVKLLRAVDFVQYKGKYATYAISAKNALSAGQEASWGGKGFDKQFYIPIDAFKLFWKDPRLEAVSKQIGVDWTLYLAKYFLKGNLFRVLRYVNNEIKEGKTVYPEPSKIFRAFKLCPLRNVKCVIIGQDPYHSPAGQATGLSFGCGVNVSPSLRNIIKELDDDIPAEINGMFGQEEFDITLEKWARQGVFLLNSSLTVLEKRPGSHSNIGWAQAIVLPALHELAKRKKNLAFIVWGAHAREVVNSVPRKGEFLYVRSAHPSPFSADKGFFGSRPFSKVNKYLKAHKQSPINWR